MVNIEVLFEEINILESPEKKLCDATENKSSSHKLIHGERLQKVCNYLYVGDNKYSHYRTLDDFKGSRTTMLPTINANIRDMYFNYKDGMLCCGDNPIYESLNLFKDEDVMEIYTNRKNSSQKTSSNDLETLDGRTTITFCNDKENSENFMGVAMHNISCNIDELLHRAYSRTTYSSNDHIENNRDIDAKENNMNLTDTVTIDEVSETQIIKYRSMSLIREDDEGQSSSLVVSANSETYKFSSTMVKAQKQEMNFIMSSSDNNTGNSPNDLMEKFPDQNKAIGETSVTECTHRFETEDSAEDCDYEYEDDFSMSVTSSTEHLKIYNEGCMIGGKINRKKYEDLFRKLKTDHSSLVEINALLRGHLVKHLQNKSESQNPITYMQIDEYFAKLKNYEVLKNSVETKRKSIEEEIQLLTKTLTEKREIQKKEFSELLMREKAIGFEAVSSKTGKHLPKIILEKLLSLQQFKMKELAKLRRQYIVTKIHVEQQESMRNVTNNASSTFCGLNNILESCISSELEEIDNEKENKSIEKSKTKAKIIEETSVIELEMKKCTKELQGLLEDYKKAKLRVKNSRKKYSKICQRVNKCQEKNGLILKKGLFKDYYNAIGRISELTNYLTSMKRFYKEEEAKLGDLNKNMSKSLVNQHITNNNIYDYTTNYIFKSPRLRIDEYTLQKHSISSISNDTILTAATSGSCRAALFDEDRSASLIITVPSKQKVIPLFIRNQSNPKYNLQAPLVTNSTLMIENEDADNKENDLQESVCM